jgi:hypothetical protein
MLSSDLTNSRPVYPDAQGDVLQQYAAKIRALDAHAVVPHDHREARALLAELEARDAPKPLSRGELDGAQYAELYNSRLRDVEKAKARGLLPKDFRLPRPPSNGICTPDRLRELQDIVGDIDEKLQKFESQTPDQRRISNLEARLDKAMPAVIEHANRLAAEVLELREKVARLEGVIVGPRSATESALMAEAAQTV